MTNQIQSRRHTTNLRKILPNFFIVLSDIDGLFVCVWLSCVISISLGSTTRQSIKVVVVGIVIVVVIVVVVVVEVEVAVAVVVNSDITFHQGKQLR